METEFYKSIPPEIREKLQEYVELYSTKKKTLQERRDISDCFIFCATPEGRTFWMNHYEDNTFPIWSDELNRFIDPPTQIDINENPNKFYPL